MCLPPLIEAYRTDSPRFLLYAPLKIESSIKRTESIGKQGLMNHTALFSYDILFSLYFITALILTLMHNLQSKFFRDCY